MRKYIQRWMGRTIFRWQTSLEEAQKLTAKK